MNEDDLSTIKSNVAQFISNNNDRYEVISIFQDNLNHITEERYTDTINFIENNVNIFFKDHESAILFLYNIVHFSIYNYKKLELILDVCVYFWPQMMKVNVSDIDLIEHCSHFLPAINYLFDKKLISISSIIQKSIFHEHLFINFLPEIEEFDQEYSKLRSERFFLSKENYIYVFDDHTQHLKDFLLAVQYDHQKHKLNRQFNYHPSLLHKSIREDDIDTFQQILSSNNYDINYQMEYSFYERTCTADKNPSLIQVAAVYGSLKIFKFLWMQTNIKLNDNLQCYAYSGRDYEIIHICEQKCPKNKVLRYAISSHQHDLEDYFLENFGDQTELDEKSNIVKEKLNNLIKKNDVLYNDIDYSNLLCAVQSGNYKIILSHLEEIVIIVKYIESNNESMMIKDFSSFLVCCLFDIELFKFLYNFKNPNLSFSDCSFTLYLDVTFNGAYDVFQFLIKFEESQNLINIFRNILFVNSHMANIILNYAAENDELLKLFKKEIKMSDLIIAIKFYNEDTIAKMISLFRLTDSDENLQKFMNEISTNVSKKMEKSIISRISSDLPKK